MEPLYHHPTLYYHNIIAIAIAIAKSLQSCPTLCNPIDGSPPGSAVPGFQARTLEWVAISVPNPWKGKVKVKSLSRVWLSDPMDCSLPGSSVHGIFQATVLEWGATAFSECSYLHMYNSNSAAEFVFYKPIDIYFWTFCRSFLLKEFTSS